MAKTVCKLLGLIFLIVGIVGIFSHDLLGAHLSMAHNMVHIVSGVIALYFGFSGSYSGARAFCLIFGAVYLLLGICGFVLGHEGVSTMAGMAGADPKLWKLLPGTLELGRMDHIIHVLLYSRVLNRKKYLEVFFLYGLTFDQRCMQCQSPFLMNPVRIIIPRTFQIRC